MVLVEESLMSSHYLLQILLEILLLQSLLEVQHLLSLTYIFTSELLPSLEQQTTLRLILTISSSSLPTLDLLPVSLSSTLNMMVLLLLSLLLLPLPRLITTT